MSEEATARRISPDQLKQLLNGKEAASLQVHVHMCFVRIPLC
jgi:hypothetical protein